MTGYGAAGSDLPTFLRQHAPMTPQKGAVFAATLAEQLAALHADGRALGALDAGVRVEIVTGVARPVVIERATVTRPGSPDTAAEDVHGVGVLLVRLLGAELPRGPELPRRPDAVPDSLWSLVANCLTPNPAARPTAAVLARQLRDTARDLLLGVSAWPSATGLAHPADPGTPTGADIEIPVPGYVPGPDSTSGPDVPARSPRRRGRQLLVATTVAVLVLAAVGIAFAITGSAPDQAPTAADKTAVTAVATTPNATKPAAPKPTMPRRSTAPPAPAGGNEPARPPALPSPAKPNPPAPTVVCLPPDCAARATFQPVDEHLIVCDNKSDGYAAVAIYTAGTSGEKKVWASNSAGTCTDKDLGVADGTRVTYKVCIGDQSENRVDRCSATVTRTA